MTGDVCSAAAFDGGCFRVNGGRLFPILWTCGRGGGLERPIAQRPAREQLEMARVRDNWEELVGAFPCLSSLRRARPEVVVDCFRVIGSGSRVQIIGIIGVRREGGR